MRICPQCGRENAEDARFCSACGARLDPAHEPAREERKVVSVLFADLVGFTSKAERLDPEDVRATLSPYYAQLRSELERHGGTVEKFIGDAVMALFGAPAAHEDDPERAVRAALAIRDWAREEERLQVRIAVNTGDALVTLGARPSEGEGMAAGDVINSAARLQAAAPVNGILVGERTYRATRHAIDYRELEPVAAKGKEEPLKVWEALQAHARLGVDVPHEARSPLAGRERELEILRSALGRARDEGSPQLVTLVGVPGIGKSRLLYELSQIVEAEPELISWRQGRSLPYAEGLSFWALAEIVKAQAGILETDEAEVAEQKLAETVADIVSDEADAGWVRRHLAALAGLGGGESATGDDRRSEAFAAWRRFLEALAEQRPLVLVFEDLHWADDGLLDFVDHLVEWASGVPILVVGTARPELLDRRPGWGGGKPNATTLSLSALSAEDTARLLGSALGRPLLEAGEQAELLERVGGNPLYAEQYAQMLGERGEEGDLPLPESVHGIIGARLDALPVVEKQLLQDAAVIGKVFWPGAVAALGSVSNPVELEEHLHSLERKQFVRRDRRSSVADQTQYAFLHLLLRDVAYAQIPRATRVEKHVRAAGWIDALGRAEDHAEMVAHHYLSALEIAREAGQETTGLAPRARAALVQAGDRARRLNAYAASLNFYREALELWPEEALERTGVLFRLALTAFEADAEERAELLEKARTALLAAGDRSRAAEMDALLAQFSWLQGDRDRCFEHLERAQELVRDEPPSPAKARVLSQVARFRSLAGKFDPDQAREALELAETFGLDEIRAQALITISVNDRDSRALAEQGLQIAIAGNFLPVAVRAYTVLATFAETDGDLREGHRLMEEAEKVAERLGGASMRWVRGNLIMAWLELGDWDRYVPAADEFLAEAETAPHYHDSYVRLGRALIRLARDDVDGALADQAKALERARQVKDPQVLYPTLASSAFIFADVGRIEESQRLFEEVIAAGADARPYLFDDLVWAADLLDRRAQVASVLPDQDETPRFRAARAVLAEEFVQAAAIFESVGSNRFAAVSRLRAAERLVRGGRRSEADEQLWPALEFYRSVGATRYIREGEALLAASA